MFEVSPRAIYRDIDAINMAGIPVRSISGVGGGFEIMPEYKNDKNDFSTADLSAILIGLSNEYIAHRGDRSVRTVEPYQLVLKSSHWYFYEYCYSRNDYRLFRLSRMSSLQIEQETFVLQDYQRPISDFDKIIETMQIEIKIRIHKSVLDRVLEFCTYDHFLPDGDEHYIVNFPFIENEYYYDILFSFGDKCECLEPLHIRTKVKHKIHDMATIYSD